MSEETIDDTATQTEEVALSGEDREVLALAVVKRNAIWAAGVGLIAVPWVDIAGVTIVQLKMLKELAEVYDMPFSDDIGKASVAALISGLGHRYLAAGVIGSTIKAIPGLGSLFGAVSVPAFAAAVSYAVGRVFIQHFESGGTFLNFNPSDVRARFKQEFESAQAQAVPA